MNNKISNNHVISCILFFVFIAAIGYLIGFFHQKYIYDIWFHGDSAAMQVLARAIVDEHSLLPKDFSYGNQLIFLRSSSFIALAMALGADGYKAFIIGSSLSASFWFLVLFLAINTLTYSRIKSLSLSIAVFLPVGYHDLDIVLGQQSHLANIVLGIVSSIFSYQYLNDKKIKNFILSLIPIIIIASEAPIRGALVAIPVIVTACLCFYGRAATKFTIGMLMSLVIGLILNKLLIRITGTLGIDVMQSLSMRSTDEILKNLLRLFSDLLNSSMSSTFFIGMGVSGIGMLFFALSLFFTFLFVTLIFYGLYLSGKQINWIINQKNIPKIDPLLFFIILSSMGVFIGLMIMASIYPDSPRHIQWTVALIKLEIGMMVFAVVSRSCKSDSISLAATIILFISFSCWVPVLLNKHYPLSDQITFHKDHKLHKDLLVAMKDTGIYHVYGGDFWEILPLNAIDNKVSAGELTFDGNRFYPRNWLSRPSWFCQKGDALYFLNPKTLGDTPIVNYLKEHGGKVIFTSGDISIWRNGPIWERPDNCGR